ncbi:hypothetical protein [Convivina praedatoris]|uniref:Uncharacterized protein n=1 Tax=Convivina praedatoris TaxID=2880963 RepID=A0ABN8HE56_9LACO|nr:hypothetical protein [Convivina sp. LMG 32447]CAH1854602.1 hypothetical protein R078138_00912 [Convivina sp. LMG 32447]CAH1857077.1 hypothetical protein R077815_01541 [Convivina sp. LMG 32447]CAH1857494.1 hypothetical protein LMG032447_01573 [Convivina sp. LMG 32447]
MKKITIILAITSWLLALFTLIQAYLTDNLLSLLPIYAYNSPQGRLGWSLTVAIILSILSFILKQSKK